MTWAICATGCPVDLLVTYSSHYCSTVPEALQHRSVRFGPPGGHYTHRVIQLAVRLVVEDGLPYRPASWHLWRDHRVFVPFAPYRIGQRPGEKKAQGQMDGAFLDWALAVVFGLCGG